MLENLIVKNCPKCQSSKRYWHQAGVFLVTQAKEDSGSGGFAQAAAVICPDCGLIEFYADNAQLLRELPQAEVPTAPPEEPTSE